ncbi:sodium- and chloride-dependent glycine transporter 1-like [Argopecten irradians]|uniref:sodium- and chloride-dependent glycine transporter 1-like n=1 Tax=Argopecten irradians TaxID=31199 RepID=UPI00371EBC53
MTGSKMPHVFRLAAAYISPVLFTILLRSSFVTYRPPKYGSYEYPDYTRIIGWILSCLVVVPIPLHIVWQLANVKGTIKQKWKSLTRPSRTWGPSDSARSLKYLDQSQDERPLKILAFYNITGRQRCATNKRCEEVSMLWW